MLTTFQPKTPSVSQNNCEFHLHFLENNISVTLRIVEIILALDTLF